MIYVHYSDEGPLGICGQSMSITSNWNKLYKFKNYEDFKEIVERMVNITHRKNPKVFGIWGDGKHEGYFDEVIKYGE